MSSKDESLLADLASLIPGYGAYREHESRREDDRLTREFLGKRITDCKSQLDAMAAAAANAGDLELPSRLEKLRKQLDLAQNRIASAVEGYSGWFNQRNVDTKTLEQVAKLDSNLVSVVDQIDQLCRSEPVDPQKVQESLELLHQRIDRRCDVLKNA